MAIETSATMEQHRHSMSHTGPCTHSGTCANSSGGGGFLNGQRCDFTKCMRYIGFIHLFFAAFFAVDHLVHMFWFPYLANTVPIRVASFLLIVLNILLAVFALGAVKGNPNKGNPNKFYNGYMFFNIFAMILILFLMLINKVEAIFMIMARLAYIDADRRVRLDNYQLSYATHPLWALCLCYAFLIFMFIAHLFYQKVACGAKHAHVAYTQLPQTHVRA